ncbi:MAG: hypothetical protein M1837_002309 [Sclerophora amabilis]|nr:MAG: hypothetical protein M1837_002309 [Sclerophora amabilis]
MPASFASAAAGNSTSDGSSATRAFSRNDSGGSGDWSRARVNGSVPTTFRRPSQPTPTPLQQQSKNSESVSSPGVYVPPHHHHNGQSFRNGTSTASRFSKEQLLQVYKSQSEDGDLGKDVAGLVMGDWSLGSGDDPNNWPWNRKEDKESHGNGPDICWDPTGSVVPLGLIEMSDEEREHFSTSVNSPLKPPPQSVGKDQAGTSNGVVGRNHSQGQNVNSAFSVSSPTTSRPMTRRRDTSDSVPYSGNPLTSPAVGKFAREESNTQTPPSLLSRRKAGYREISAVNPPSDEDKEASTSDDFPRSSPSHPNLTRRSTTGPLSANTNVPPSPWAGGSGTFSPMGSFGNFGLNEGSNQPPTPGEKRPGFGSVRGGSRLSKFMGHDTSDEPQSAAREGSSIAGLGKVSESETEHFAHHWGEARARRPMSGDTDPFGDEDGRVGSAALGGRQDDSPPNYQSTPGYGTSSSNPPRSDYGLVDMGISSRLPGFMDAMSDHPQQQDEGQIRHYPPGNNEPLSPTETNPYHSPVNEATAAEDIDADDSEMQSLNHPGNSGLSGEQGAGNMGHVPRAGLTGNDADPGDRSQASSTGPGRGLSNLGTMSGLSGIGNLGGWPASAGPTGTFDRENSGFGGPFGKSVFGPLEDLQSPNQSGPGGGIFGAGAPIGSSGSGTIGRGSKLGSLFPPAMQAQMQGRENVRQGHEDEPGDAARRQRQFMGGDVAGHMFPGQARDTDSPLRTGRGIFDDMFFSGLEGKNSAFATDNSLVSNEPTSAPFNQPPTSDSLPTPTSVPPGQINTLNQASQTQRSGGQQITSPIGNPQSQTNQPPQTQQRTMVMPDRMRWIYKDPQGKTQGPWSGLEMHDWFKAGFFSAELLVKKFEEEEYEPLGQLIRRIGNSREPFLVPQIGIPHGPSAGQSSVQWNAPPPTTGVSQPSNQAGAVQPPFASAFPSFGTTLTAEQQNNLERRKQEEQYLMARQKEWLTHKQTSFPQIHSMQGSSHTAHPQQLHHHSSAHSLQSQPSFGSITSPTGNFHPTPPQAPVQPPQGVPGLFDNQPRQNASSGFGPPGGLSDLPGAQNIRDDEFAALMARTNLGRDSYGLGSVPLGSQQDSQSHQSQVAAVLSQRAQLQREQAQQDAMQSRGPMGHHDPTDRLQQFNELRSQPGDDSAYQRSEGMVAGKPIGPSNHQSDPASELKQLQRDRTYPAGVQMSERTPRTQPTFKSAEQGPTNDPEPEILSLTQQVQKAASAKQSPALSSQQESVWNRGEKAGMPHPFPPPMQSVSPLPAPAAQRNRQNLPDALNVESRSRSETPSGETPGAPASIAPWAKENQEGTRGPSLKKIQEAEARKAAKAEEAAAAARRALSEQERYQQVGVVAPAPGLPASSTWASSGSPIIPSSTGPSAWTTPSSGKPSNNSSGVGSMKKTLSQIQKEEESRKHKVAASSVANASTNPVNSQSIAASGKRYADLASKAAPAPSSNVGGAWTTVGASGKPKNLSGTATTGPPPGLRMASSGAVPTLAGNLNKAKPALAHTRSTTFGSSLPGQTNANDEFTKWAKGALSKGLNSNINVDDFVQQLLMFPPEAEIISESVYANSQTMDGRRFAEEFIRRRKLADKGVVDGSAQIHGGSPSGAQEHKGSGGWSEVAKKGTASTPREAEANSAFKVVAAKKKGKK